MLVQTQGGSLSAAARDTLRRALAILAGQKISQVAIESVSRAKTGPGITMALSVAMGVDVLAAQSLVAALLVSLNVLETSLTCVSIYSVLQAPVHALTTMVSPLRSL